MVGQKTYPDAMILCCLTLGLVYGQKLRQTTGLVASLLRMMNCWSYAVPDYTTLCLRQSCLHVELNERWQEGQKLDIAFDSTGLKVFGEGEWKVRRHGASQRRTWRKLHVGIEVDTQEIVSVTLTGNGENDAAMAGRMLEGKVDQLSSFRGDGAYDDLAFGEKLGPGVIRIILSLRTPWSTRARPTSRRRHTWGKETKRLKTFTDRGERNGRYKVGTTSGRATRWPCTDSRPPLGRG